MDDGRIFLDLNEKKVVLWKLLSSCDYILAKKSIVIADIAILQEIVSRPLFTVQDLTKIYNRYLKSYIK